MRVLAAMSGGVDSSVAAARLVDAGHEVTGVHLALAAKPATAVEGHRGCCTLDDARDARRVADLLGIAFYVWDFAEEFADRVIGDFVEEYRARRTPNPCLRCNEHIKFRALLDRALALGFDAVATGHYARIVDGTNGPELHRAADADKDQSYVLGVLERHQLEHALFPLGDDVKSAVRDEADRRGLLVARKPDSHDLCFIPTGDTVTFLRDRIGARPGAIVDAQSGAEIGHHDGTYAFTIGQRRGLALGNLTGDGERRYVVGIDPARGAVVVGGPELLDIAVIEADRPRWAGEPIGADPVPVFAQVRAHGAPVPAQARMEGDRLVVDLRVPIRGLAAGQAVVLYDGTRVVGSATVTRTHSAALP